MNRHLGYLLVLLMVCMGRLGAQNMAVLGLDYQAVARDADGQILSGLPLTVKVAFTQPSQPGAFLYSESHQVVTDEQGLFQLVIGNGLDKSGNLSELPWSEGGLWLELALSSDLREDFLLVSRTELLAVPYAFHALEAGQLVEDQTLSLRNQSIYWTTSGNEKTRPSAHFYGTRDAEDFVLKTNNATRMVLTKDGQMQIYAGNTGPLMNGDQDTKASYPLTVEGSTQGIYIEVKGLAGGEANMNNNFMTFADGQGIKGRIEGQTLAELLVSDDFVLQNLLFALEAAQLVAGGIAFGATSAGDFAAAVAAAASLVLAFAAPGFTAAGVGALANAVGLGVNAASLAIQVANFYDNAISSVGVIYETGGADYAEWLERAPGVADLHPGDVIGVRAGLISLNTENADHLMVVSSNPIFVGNAPETTAEKTRFERVAFLGQVPVRVIGPVQAGDYLLPSGNHDGLAVAIAPADIQPLDYSRAIGIAWETTPGRGPVSYVKAGIGLQHNDLAGEVAEIENKIDRIVAYLEGKGPLRPDDAFTAAAPAPEESLSGEAFGQLLSDEAFDAYIDEHADWLRDYYRQLEANLRANGMDVGANPLLRQLFDDPVGTAKQLRRDPGLSDQWRTLDSKLINKN